MYIFITKKTTAFKKKNFFIIKLILFNKTLLALTDIKQAVLSI